MTTRRKFLQTSLATAIGVPCGRAQNIAAAKPADAARKLRIAGIGIAGMGRNNLTNLASEDIVALCDVDHKLSAEVFRKFPAAKQ